MLFVAFETRQWIVRCS